MARVGSSPISADELRRELVRNGADFLDSHLDESFKQRVLEDLIRIRVLADAARREGITDRPEVKQEVDRLLAETYWRERVIETVGVPEISPAEIEAYYDEHQQDYREPERARGAVILLRKPPAAKPDEITEIRKTAELLRQKATATPSAFEELARQHSDDPSTRARGGDMGSVVRGASVFRWDQPVTDALFALDEEGDVSSVIETDRGFHVVKLVERSGGSTKPLEAVEIQVRQQLVSQRTKALHEARYEKLREGVEVQIDREVFEATGPPPAAADGSKPPSFPLAVESKG